MKKRTRVDLKEDHYQTIKSILSEHLPKRKIRVFGSRITGRAKPFSDLDLVIMTKHPISNRQMALLKEAFSESNLPIKVDIVDWSDVSRTFRNIIKKTSRPF